MAKTTVYIALQVGPQLPPSSAYVVFRAPYRYVNGAITVLPEPAPVALAADGTGTVSVDPGVWLVDEVLPTQVLRRAVVVPSSVGGVQYADLKEVVNPVDVGYGPSWALTALEAAQAAEKVADEVAAVRDQIQQENDILRASIESTLSEFRTARTYGAKGDNKNDDGPLINAALQAISASGGGELQITAGAYRTSVPILQPANVRVILSSSARIIAAAEMPVLWQQQSPDWGTSGAGWADKGLLLGGIFECANLATIGIELTGFKGFTAGGFVVRNAVRGFVAGTNSTHSSYELDLRGFWLDRDKTAKNPVDSIGISILSTDSWITNGLICGYESGTFSDQASNMFSKVHVWSWEQPVNGVGTNLHKWGFVDRKDGSSYVQCDADTPSVAGWYIGGSYVSFVKCRVFLNNFAVDNVAVGYAMMYTGSRPAYEHLHFSSSSAKKLAADVSGPGTARPGWLVVTVEPPSDWTTSSTGIFALNPVSVGATYKGTAPTVRRLDFSILSTTNRMRQVEVMGGGTTGFLRGTRADGADIWRLDDNGAQPIESMNQGGWSRWFRGNYATETVRIDAGLGRIQLGYPDGGRNVFIQSSPGNPAANATQPGANDRGYDLSANGHIYYWNGTGWGAPILG